MTRTLITIAFLLLLAAVYVLSYAPMYRWEHWRDDMGDNFIAEHHVRRDTDWDYLYVPVERLIDNTALREPLLWWSDVWGVRGPIETESEWRQ